MDAFTGEVRLLPYGFVPENWLPCNGQTLYIQNYAALYSVIGLQYGGNGVTNFAVPDLQGKVVIGADGNQALPVGLTGGEAAHTLTVSEIPQHNHSVAASTSAGTSASPVSNVWAAYSNNIQAYGKGDNTKMNENAIAKTGENQPHNNMQPYLALQYCICVNGIYPARS